MLVDGGKVGAPGEIAVSATDGGKVGARVGIAVGAVLEHDATEQKGPLVEVGVVL